MVVVLGPTLDLLYSSPFGGSLTEFGRGAATWDTNLLLIAGATDSLDLPIESAFQPAINGSVDSFVAAFRIVPEPSGASLALAALWSLAVLRRAAGAPVLGSPGSRLCSPRR